MDTREIRRAVVAGGVVALVGGVAMLTYRANVAARQRICAENCERALTRGRSMDFLGARASLSDARSYCEATWGANLVAIDKELTAAEKAAKAKEAAPPMVPRPPGPMVTPKSVPPGTWALIPKPGSHVPDTGENRVAYMEVLNRVPGEPPINRAKALSLMAKLRAVLAKNASVDPSAITVNVGDASGSVTIRAGTLARVSARGEEYNLPVCSEGLFAGSMVIAETTPDVFAAAGVRGVMCKSDGCSAVMDMRPTAPGGGVYGGARCVSFAQFVKLATGER